MKFRLGIDFDVEVEDADQAEAFLGSLVDLVESVWIDALPATSTHPYGDEAKRSMLERDIRLYGYAQTAEVWGDDEIAGTLGDLRARQLAQAT